MTRFGECLALASFGIGNSSMICDSQTDALTEQLDAAKNEENLAKSRLQSLRFKVRLHACLEKSGPNDSVVTACQETRRV